MKKRLLRKLVALTLTASATASTCTVSPALLPGNVYAAEEVLPEPTSVEFVEVVEPVVDAEPVIVTEPETVVVAEPEAVKEIESGEFFAPAIHVSLEGIRTEDNDTLFEGFAEKILYGDLEPDAAQELTDGVQLKTLPAYYAARRAGLDARKQIVYDELKRMAEEVALGKRSDTILKVEASRLGTLEMSTGQVEEYLQSIYNEIPPILFADLPFEMYWCDKTRMVQPTLPGLSIRPVSGGIVLGGYLDFGFCVAADYALNGRTGTTTADTSKTGAVVTAKNNAIAIRDKYKSSWDVEKLRGYKNEICDLVDYNYDALYNQMSYGNPWQLIWVFDKDPNTKVVCEGYAKAFQYLCALTTFDNKNMESMIMTGDAGGPHMWNVVRMRNDRLYHVDVTWSDGRGNEDYFLKGDPNGTADGYTIAGSRYVYDNETKALYSEAERTLSKGASFAADTGTEIVAVSSVTLDKKTLSLKTGQTGQLTATVQPANATNKNVTWTSNNTNVATVSGGTVTAKAAGTATITVTTADGSKKATCTVTVTNPTVAVSGVTLDKTTLSLKTGQTGQLSATVMPANATNKNVTWASSNTNVATVSGGSVTAKSAGTATITVTTADGSKTATCTVTVTNPTVAVSGVTLDKTTLSLKTGQTGQLSATVMPANATNKNVTWTSNNTNVATVSGGTVTAKAAGTATITVKTADGSKTATCTVTVTNPTVAVSGVTLDKTTLSLKTGQTGQLSATVMPANATNKNVTWASSNTNVATVSGGTVTAKAAGTATITVTTADGSKTATCTVTVTNPTDDTGEDSEEEFTSGWKQQDGKWLYYDDKGDQLTDTWKKISGKWYYFDANGYMQTGWFKLSGKWYYLKSTGAMATGWVKVSGKWYYMNSSGVMQTGWLKQGSTWYYLNTGGDMATGWQKVSGKWYYFESSGVMLVNTSKKIGSKTYQFNASGVCTNA